MIILYNCRKLKSLYENVFQKNSVLIDSLTLLLKSVNQHDINKRIKKIVSNIFSKEFQLIFLDNKLGELFQLHQSKFSSYIKSRNKRFPKKIYSHLFDYLSSFDLDYEKIFKIKNFNSDEKPLLKTLFVQSLIRILFSTEKERFISNRNYEYHFLCSIVRKCLFKYKSTCGDMITSLFRKDNLMEDILKNILFIYGSSFVYKLYIENLFTSPLFGPDCSNDSRIQIVNDFFDNFDGFILRVMNTIPVMLKFILRIIHFTVQEYFDIAPNNFKPLFTYLIFNFIFSPKLQNIFQIGPQDHSFMLDINRIIRNICFNDLFKHDDDLSRFNNIIPNSHKKLINSFEKILASIECFDESMFVTMNRQYLDYPRFLFYFDCSYILGFLNKIEEFQIDSGIPMNLKPPIDLNLSNSFMSEKIILKLKKKEEFEKI